MYKKKTAQVDREPDNTKRACEPSLLLRNSKAAGMALKLQWDGGHGREHSQPKALSTSIGVLWKSLYPRHDTTPNR